ncbi:MAG: hypothetical protein QW318_06225 [Candidatus Caldarchaeum sp.]
MTNWVAGAVLIGQLVSNVFTGTIITTNRVDLIRTNVVSEVTVTNVFVVRTNAVLRSGDHVKIP